MTKPRRIGILGGMGPQATILLQQRLVDAVQVKDDPGHIPLIIDMNPQVPSRIEHLIHNRGADPAPVLAAMAKRLQSAGAQALAMPCNTAHHYSDTIRRAVSVPLLDMVELSAKRVANELDRGSHVGILASPAVQMTGLFDRALAKVGLNAHWTENGPDMLRAIQLVKAKGPCPAAREIITSASAALLNSGATYQLIACSEFSLLSGSVHHDVRCVDTLDVLVEAIIDFSFNGNGALESAE